MGTSSPLARAADRHVLAVYGGVGYGPQRWGLRRGIDVLVACPGGLEDLIAERTVDLDQVDIVVVDEADRMADMGFLPAVRRLLDATTPERQTLPFSATLDGDVAVLTRDYQRDPVRHEVGAIEPEQSDVRHHFWTVEGHDRLARAQEVIDTAGPAMVFTRTRHGADRLAKQLVRAGVRAVAMHGGRSQGQRERALGEFASGRARALVATDVAARGMHVDQVGCVLHFDLPADDKTYLHRSGRTGRAGATGTVVSLVGGSDVKQARLLQRTLGLDVPVQAPPAAGLGDASDLMGGMTRANESGERGGRRSRRPATPRYPRPGWGRPPRSSDAVDMSDSGSRSFYVGNLAFGVTTADLRELFGGFSEVRSATVITNRQTGRSRGFGFVEMPDGAARAATERLQGSSFKGRQIQVKEARPRRPHS